MGGEGEEKIVGGKDMGGRQDEGKGVKEVGIEGGR